MPKKKTKALGDDEEAIEQKMLKSVQNSGKELGDLTMFKPATFWMNLD